MALHPALALTERPRRAANQHNRRRARQNKGENMPKCINASTRGVAYDDGTFYSSAQIDAERAARLAGVEFTVYRRPSGQVSSCESAKLGQRQGAVPLATGLTEAEAYHMVRRLYTAERGTEDER